ncbi:ZDH15 Palmitoyltransferase, partial [Corythaeola cristata]|nr:ZDH15 Palmitoyltransferase [Corythaeola cristata]
VAYLIIFHILFVLFVWTYWKSIFTLPVQPGKKYHMSYADKERYENEERPEVQRQILAEIARKLPVYTRTGSGVDAVTTELHCVSLHRKVPTYLCSAAASSACSCVTASALAFLLFVALKCLQISGFYLSFSLVLCCFAFQGELTNGRSKFHVLFLLFVAVMFFVSLMFLFGYHCWLVSRNRSTL